MKSVSDVLHRDTCQKGLVGRHTSSRVSLDSQREIRGLISNRNGIYYPPAEGLFSSRKTSLRGTIAHKQLAACTRGANADLPAWYKRPPLCCRCTPTHGDLLGLGGSVSVLETWPASPGSWYATWDSDCSAWRAMLEPSRMMAHQGTDSSRVSVLPGASPYSRDH